MTMTRRPARFHIAIPIYEGVDLLDVAAPCEMFRWMGGYWMERKVSAGGRAVVLLATSRRLDRTERPRRALRPGAGSSGRSAVRRLAVSAAAVGRQARRRRADTVHQRLDRRRPAGSGSVARPIRLSRRLDQHGADELGLRAARRVARRHAGFHKKIPRVKM